MPQVLIVSESAEVRAEVRSVLSGPDIEVVELSDGRAVLPTCQRRLPDLVVHDSDVGNKGAVANCLDLRLEASAGRLGRTKVLILLDRRADVFLARRAGADGFVVKPLDPIRLRRAITTILDGGTFDDVSYQPVTVDRETLTSSSG